MSARRDDAVPAQEPDDVAMEFVVRLGGSLTEAGIAVSEVQTTLLTVSDRLGLRRPDVVILPTAIMIQVGTGAESRSRLRGFQRSWLRLDQISALDDLTRLAERGDIEPAIALRRLAAIHAAGPPMPRTVRVLGMGVLSTGFALLLQPTAIGILLAFGLGLFVGVLRVVDLPGLDAVQPIVATFVVSIVVFKLTAAYGGQNPIRILIPPLVLFLPGAALTTGTTELAVGDTVSGASRIVEGIVNLLLLAFGILAAAAVVSIPDTDLADHPVPGLGWTTPLIGLVVITLGHYLHNCAPARTLGWITVVSAAAYGGQAAGAALVSPQLSGFFGAVIMTPLILWLTGRPGGPPRMTLFLPAFWVLVPGAVGLIGLTQAVAGANVTTQNLADTVMTVSAIALGTLVGAAIWNSGHHAVVYVRGRVRRR